MQLEVRPRPYSKNLSYLEAKFDGIYEYAVASETINATFKDSMASIVSKAQIVGTMLLCRQRRRHSVPRLPSEVWHLMLMEFGAPTLTCDHIPIMYLQKPIPTAMVMPTVWDIYTTHTSIYLEEIEEAKKNRDIMKRFMRMI